MANSITRFLDHTQRRTTVGRTPMEEWSARRRDLYLTTHTKLTTNVHDPGGIWTYNLSRWTAADLPPRPRGHCDRQVVTIAIVNVIFLENGCRKCFRTFVIVGNGMQKYPHYKVTAEILVYSGTRRFSNASNKSCPQGTNQLYRPPIFTDYLKIHINPLTPELNPSAQRCLTRFFTEDFASWTVNFVNIRMKNQQIHQLCIILLIMYGRSYMFRCV
jgi:hypothetical protein